MNKKDVLSNITNLFALKADSKKALVDFYNENKDIPDNEFYQKLNTSLPWVDYSFKLENLWRLKRIDNHLLFFKVITIISIIIGVLIALLISAK